VRNFPLIRFEEDVDGGMDSYANMDYIFFSAILGVALLTIAISYDIVCQWKININERIDKLPARLTEQPPEVPPLAKRLRFGLPVWHAAAHERDCQVTNSLRYQHGMENTDGEGMERGWSRVNGQSSSTKEMGPGNRHDTLDDHFGYHNWQRNIGLGACHHYGLWPAKFAVLIFGIAGDSLKNKLHIAIDERNQQVDCFKEIKNTINKDTVKGFKEQVEAWEKDSSNPNPYLAPKKGVPCD
jgi:hypothetical protein